MPIPVIAVAATVAPTPIAPNGLAASALTDVTTDLISETTLYVISATPTASTPEAIASKFSTTRENRDSRRISKMP